MTSSVETITTEKIADIDRRLRPRIETALYAKIGSDEKVKLLNTSDHGICFSTTHRIKPKDLLATIELPSGCIQTKIKVRWANSAGLNGCMLCGASFEKLDQKTLSIIRKYIVSHQFKLFATEIKDRLLRKHVLVFAKNFRDYLFGLVDLERSAAEGSLEEGELQKKLTALNTDIVMEGERLKGRIANKLLYEKIKREFRRLVSPWAFKSQIMKRGFDKPKGYPGDYRTLEIIYNFETFSPHNDLGFFFDKYFLENPYADAVRNRKNILREILARVLREKSGSIKVLNLASGSCREIRELFEAKDKELLRKEILFSCVDWDEDASNFSSRELQHLPANIRVDFIKEDIITFTKNANFFEKNGGYDLVYSIGLADYLPDRVLKNLIKTSFEGLNRGGEFVIAHKDKEINFSHLPPEWFCDWVFIPRNQEDLLSLVRAAGLGDTVSRIERDSTRQIFFISLVKG